MLKDVMWLSGIMAFEHVEEVLARVGQIHLSDSSAWRRAQTWGAQFRALEESGLSSLTIGAFYVYNMCN